MFGFNENDKKKERDFSADTTAARINKTLECLRRMMTVMVMIHDDDD